MYIWVYGTGSIKSSILRRVAYLAETITRPLLSRRPSSLLTRTFWLIALGYLAFNTYRHMRNPQINRYNLNRAVHAARDRFTPRYAHRHGYREVLRWFQEAGFEEMQMVRDRARCLPPTMMTTGAILGFGENGRIG